MHSSPPVARRLLGCVLLGRSSAALFVLFVPLAASQTPPTPARDLTASFQVAPGVSVREWATSPRLANPTAIDVDARGRVWVAEAVNYRKWDGRNPGVKRDGGDRIVILEDTDGDGACDRSTVFAQDEDLVSPLGLCVLDDRRVLVSCSPHAILYTDKDGDGVSDAKEIFLSGFGGHDHDHGLHSFVMAPDGRLWCAVGNAGPHRVTDRGGFRLQSGSLYRDGGARPADNVPGLVSDDFLVWTGGLVLRVDPDGTNLSVMAHNFRNEYEVALDSFGRAYTADNDDDGNQACRTLRILEGGNHGYFSADGSRYWTADRRPGQATMRAHWHQDDPGVAPAGRVNGSGGPTGVCVYESDVIDGLRDAVLDADAGRNRVWIHRPRTVGAGCELDTDVLIAAKTGEGAEAKASWFRPSDVCVAPDGTLYVSDWSDPGVGGHAMADREAQGRILHLVPSGRALAPVPADLLSNPARTAEALANPCVHVHARAAQQLRARGDAARDELTRLVASEDPHVAARALWALGFAPESGLAALQSALTSTGTSEATANSGAANSSLRATAVRIVRSRWCGVFPTLSDGARKLLSDAAIDFDPEVRAEVAITMRDVPYAISRNALLAIASTYDGKDRAYLEAFGIGASDKEASLWPELLKLLGDPDPTKWSPAFAGIAWRLHPTAAVPGWFARAHATALSLEDRSRAIDALAFTNDRTAAEAVLDLAVGGPRDTRALAAWWIRNRDTNDWSEWKLARQLGDPASVDEELADAEQVYTSGLMKRGGREFDVAITGASRLWLVVTNGTNGESCDWADWIHGRIVTDDGTIELKKLMWTSATSAWGNVNVGRNCDGGPLVVDGTTYTDGIGTHARSVIVYDLPKGSSRFLGIAAVDDGGSTQPSHASEVEFQVWIDSRARRDALRAAAKVLSDASSNADALEKAAIELCATRAGGERVLRLAADSKLAAAAKESVARHIFTNPDAAVRALASEHFVRPARSGPPLPSVAELAALVPKEGDVARGAELFFGKRAACSSCHVFHGRGGDVGPDLTAVRGKYKAPEILDSILNPSAALAFGFEAWVIETRDEELFSGFVISDGTSASGGDTRPSGTVVLKDTTGRRHVIPSSDIVSRTKQKLSVMPDNVSAALSADELVDLTAFLTSDPEAPGVRGTPIELFDGKSLNGWTFHLNTPDARIGDVWSVADGVLRCRGNPIGYLRTEADFVNFELDVEWRFDPAAGPGNSGVLLRVQAPDTVWPRSIEAQLQHQNAGDIWNIGEFPMVTDASRTDGRHTGKRTACNELPLGQWNHYHIVLDGGMLSLTVNGVLQNTATWCAELPGKIALQSEGAVIEFRRVTLTPITRKP